jgi:hypothetical protein
MKQEALSGCSGLSREEIAVMGSILPFQPRDAASIRKPNEAGASASIVIFPGVRYERHEDAARDSVSSRRTTHRDKPLPRH